MSRSSKHASALAAQPRFFASLAAASATLMLVGVLCGCSPSSAEPLAVREANLQKLSPPKTSELQSLIQDTLIRFRDERVLDTEVNAAWQIMHAVICYGEELQVQTPDRGKIGAVEYLFTEGPVNGFELSHGDPLLKTTNRPGLRARLEPGSYVGQGHVDQWIAICAMADLPLDRKILAHDSEFTLEDWVRQTQADIPNNMLNEFSWTLIALTHYLPQEPEWISTVIQNNGSTEDYELTWEDLVAEELRYGLEDVACGGTHKMAAVVRALQAKQRLGLPDTETWVEAQALVDELILAAKQYRDGQGRLSAHYFARAGSTVDLNSQLAGSGHTFEFVALAIPEEQLSENWVELAAQRLCLDLKAMEPADLDCGALYHALNGLNLYQKRRWKAATDTPETVASHP